VSIALGANPGGGALSGTTPVAAVGGVATFFDLSINKTGSGYTLTAAASGFAPVTSSAFDIAPGTATQLVFTVQPSTKIGRASCRERVQVRGADALGKEEAACRGGATEARWDHSPGITARAAR